MASSAFRRTRADFFRCLVLGAEDVERRPAERHLMLLAHLHSDGGIVHSALSQSISDHVMLIVWLVDAAVRLVNISAFAAPCRRR